MSRRNKTFLVVIVVVVCLPLTRLSGFLGGRQTSDTKRTRPDNSLKTLHGVYGYSTDGKPNTPTFIYSKEALYHTVLDIRRKNCKLANKGHDSVCEELSTCNNRSTLVTRVPPSCRKRLPRCLIIGVAKSGTREVLDFLMMNHMVLVKREPYVGKYFKDKAYNRGEDWYRNEMPYTVPKQITMEKGNYFHDPLVPRRIHEMDPDIKMLLMIRDPVDRALSFLTFHTSVEETLATLDKKMDNLTKIYGVRMSMYDEAFERYLHYFNRSQIHVVDFERFIHDPFGVLRDIETYLGLPHAIRKEDFVFNHDKGFFCLRNVGHAHSAVCFGDDRGRKNNGDPFEAYKKRLRRVFKKKNERFFKLVGRRFNWT